MNRLGNWGVLVLNAFILSAFIGYCYSLSFSYELGIFKCFQLPTELIEVHLSSFISEIAPLTATIVLTFFIVVGIAPRLSRDSGTSVLTTLGYLLPGLLILVWPVLIWQDNPIKWYVASALLLVWGSLFLLAPLFNRSLKGNYKQKFVYQQIKDALDVNKILNTIGWTKDAPNVNNTNKDNVTTASTLDHPLHDVDSGDTFTVSENEDTKSLADLYESLVELGQLYVEEGNTTADEFNKSVAETLDFTEFTNAGRWNMNKVIQYAWNEANGTVGTQGYDGLPTEIRAAMERALPRARSGQRAPLNVPPGEPFDPHNHHYFKYNGSLYRVRKHPTDAPVAWVFKLVSGTSESNWNIDRVGKSLDMKPGTVKDMSRYAEVNGAINFLIERDCKTEAEKKKRVYETLLAMAQDYANLRRGKYIDEQDCDQALPTCSSADELADAWGIERNPVMQYVWDVASGKNQPTDYDNLPPQIKTAIFTAFRSKPAMAKTQGREMPTQNVLHNNMLIRRVLIAVFITAVIALLPYLAYERGYHTAYNQVDFITFKADSRTYMAYRVYSNHVICTTLSNKDLPGQALSVFTRSSMQNIQVKALGTLGH